MSQRQKRIRTERLVLQPLASGHADAVADLFSAPEMSAHFDMDLSDRSLAEAMVEERLAYAGPPELGHWVLLLDGRVVGLAHLRPSHELPGGLAEIGWYVDARYWGYGLATEGARALLRHGLDDLRLDSVWALVRVDNAPSLRVAERLGFLDVGEGAHYGGPHRVHVALPGRA